MRMIKAAMNSKMAHIVLALSVCLHIMLVERTVGLQITGHFKTHPLLYFSGEDIPSLQEKAATTHSHLAAILKEAAKVMVSNPAGYLPPTDYEKFGGRWNEVYGNNLCVLAFYCVIYPDDVASRELAIKFMDNLHELPQWQVADLPKDEVPVAHTFIGFTTAFDFLYNHLDKARQTKFLQRITDVTKEFEHYAKVRSWGRFYLQNHVATNYLAFIHGCIVVQAHNNVADPWLNFAVQKFEGTMFLLNQIVDGSLDEGVAYGTYTTRSVTQYIFLALRHWGIDHTKDYWIGQYFWSLYYTMLPGFQKNVAIADSNYNWFYGPESQLVFLDAFVLKNGHGNWLAEEIRKRRSDYPASSSQKWSTIHTEFIWFDPSIPARPPVENPVSKLHVFSDWGVSTWSKSSPQETHDTFLAFKSGKLHGRAIFDVVNGPRYKSWVRGWESFNPGHEHPDQNMFIFAPNGQTFITDALYAPKYTHLQNVLMFAPSDTSKCFKPWVGQLGECEKWLKWKNPEVKMYGGEMITSMTTGGLVHMSGEAKDAYPADLGLKSVYRNVVLLNPHLLLVVDRVEKSPESSLKLASAFFHNTEFPFESDRLSEHIQGAKITVDKEEYRMAWIKHGGDSPVASIQVNQNAAQFQKRESKFVNVTFELFKHETTMMYVFASPKAKVLDIAFAETTKDVITADVTTSQLNYRVTMVTAHDNPVMRYTKLGFSGFAKVTSNDGQVIEFGRNEMRKVVAPSKNSDVLSGAVVIITMSIMALLAVFLKLYRLIRSRVFRIVFLLAISSVLTTLLYNIYVLQPGSVEKRSVTNGRLGYKVDLPDTVITSLPGSGAELLSQMFQHNPDFLYLTVPSKVLKMPETEMKFDSFIDACVWDGSDHSRFPEAAKWMQSFVRQPRDFIKPGSENLYDKQTETINHGNENAGESLSPLKPEDVNYKEYTNEMLVAHSNRYPFALPVLELTSGSWAIKLPWLHQIMDENLRSLYVVCDPRMWINNLLIGSPSIYQQLNIHHYLQTLLEDVDMQEIMCNSRTGYAPQFESVRQVLGLRDAQPHRILAHLWLAYTEIVIENQQLLSGKMKIVVWEDIIKDPEESIRDVYEFIDMPLRPMMSHQILQATRSDVYTIPYLGVVGQESMQYWKTQLTLQEIKDIEHICSSLMKKFGYKMWQ